MFAFESDIDGLEKMKGNYFENDEYYFYFNKEKKMLDTLLVYDLSVYHNGLAGVLQNNENEDYQLYDANYEQIQSGAYNELKEVGEKLFGSKNGKVFLIDSQGKQKHLNGIKEVGDKLSDNRILVNTKDYYGFIDMEGNLVIPAVYRDASSFFKGVTAVLRGETYKLIDPNGKVLVDTEAEDKHMDEEDADGNRVYSFDYGDKKYNYKGELISEE